MDIFKSLSNLIITSIIGTMIAQYIIRYFQNRTYINQIRIKNAEDEVKKITDTSIRIVKLSSERRFITNLLVEQLLSYQTIENSDINNTRIKYREIVDAWNIELQVLNMELSSLNLYNMSLRLENDIHVYFRNTHNVINNYIKTKGNSSLNNVEKDLNLIYLHTKNLSNDLILKANTRKEEILNGNTEALSMNNLDKAPVITLLKAIFHSSPNSLRIPKAN